MGFAYDVGRATLPSISGRSLSTAPTSTKLGSRLWTSHVDVSDRSVMASRIHLLYLLTYVVIVEEKFRIIRASFI